MKSGFPETKSSSLQNGTICSTPLMLQVSREIFKAEGINGSNLATKNRYS
jgi:hypothetical protein